jgi:hypothetical protein
MTSQPIDTAPRDGTRVMIFLAGEDAWTLGYWFRQTQAWVRWDDPDRYTLRRVTHWRPAAAPRRG